MTDFPTKMIGKDRYRLVNGEFEIWDDWKRKWVPSWFKARWVNEFHSFLHENEGASVADE